MKFWKSIIILGVIFILIPLSVNSAEDITLTASVDRKVVLLGEAIQFTLTFTGTRRVPQPDFELEGFKVNYLGPSTQISIVNGRTSSSISHVFSLLPTKVGKLTIGPLSLHYDGKNYNIQPITVEVVQEREGGQGEGDSQLSDRIFITMSVEDKEVYVNQEILLTIRLYVRDLTIRDVQYPTFSADKFLVRDYLEPTQGQEVLDGVLFEMIEFKTFLLPVGAGELTLGPAKLGSNLVVQSRSRSRSSFFGGTKRPITVKSEPITLTVRSLPSQGRPVDFAGAVGDYDLGVSANPIEVKAGEPITLIAKIRGRGNFDTLSAPVLPDLGNFKIYEPQVKTETVLSPEGTVGLKTYEQVIIPKDEFVDEIPLVSFSFFDPSSARYKIITRGPIGIKVHKLPEEEKIQIVGLPAQINSLEEEILGSDIVYIKDSLANAGRGAGYLYKSISFWGFGLLPLVALVAASLYRRKKDLLLEDLGYARLQRAPKKARRGMAEARKLVEEGKQEEFYNSASKTVREYLGDRLNIPPGGITHQVVDELREKGVSKDLLETLSSFFGSCDNARFAPSSISSQEMEDTLELMSTLIDRLEKSKLS